jgi:hypothetical protein
LSPETPELAAADEAKSKLMRTTNCMVDGKELKER